MQKVRPFLYLLVSAILVSRNLNASREYEDSLGVWLHKYSCMHAKLFTTCNGISLEVIDLTFSCILE